MSLRDRFQNSLKKLAPTRFDLPAPVENELRFAFVSDLHDAENGPVLALIREASPDAVLVGGDFVHDGRRYQKGLDFLPAAAAIAPTFVSVGNHEMKPGPDFLSPARESGAVLLDNESALFRGVRIGGLTTGFRKNVRQRKFQKTPEPDLAFLEAFSRFPEYKILLCHHPEYYPRHIRSLPVDLTLSGHAHGGQWRPFGVAVFAPGQGVFPRYTSGLYEDRLIVGRGVGNPVWVPRLWNRPEVILITLHPERRK